MNFEITPYVNVGDIKFGMKRKEVRKHFNKKIIEFKKTPLSITKTDDFSCCHVKPYSEVRAIFETIDNSLDFNDAGFVSHKYGIGIFAPFADEPNKPVESVIVFEKGYFD